MQTTIGRRTRRTLAALGALAFGLAAHPAAAQQTPWTASDDGLAVFVHACAGCEEDMMVLLECPEPGNPARLSVPALARDALVPGLGATLGIGVDGDHRDYPSYVVEWGMIGSFPAVDLAAGDPLLERLQAGRRLTLSWSRSDADIALTGSRVAIDRFKAACWPSTGEGEASQQWMSGSFDGDRPGETYAYLTFGIPETDAVGFSASCRIGARSPTIPIDLSMDYGTMRPDTPVSLSVDVDGRKMTVSARTFAESEEYSGIRADIRQESPLWAALAGGRRLEFGGVGMSTLTLSGVGLAPHLQSFQALCAQPAAPAPRLPERFTCDGGPMQVAYGNLASRFTARVGVGALSLDLPQTGNGLFSDGRSTLNLYSDGSATLSGPNLRLQCRSR